MLPQEPEKLYTLHSGRSTTILLKRAEKTGRLKRTFLKANVVTREVTAMEIRCMLK